MATEEDKTNTGVAGTAIAIGVAAMMAGSAALVGMARAEVKGLSQETQAYANLGAVKELNAEHAKKLTQAKVSIDKARASTLAALKADPNQASPWTVQAPAAGEAESAASGAGAESAAPEGTSSEAAPETSAAAASGAPAEGAAPAASAGAAVSAEAAASAAPADEKPANP